MQTHTHHRYIQPHPRPHTPHIHTPTLTPTPTQICTNMHAPLVSHCITSVGHIHRTPKLHLRAHDRCLVNIKKNLPDILYTFQQENPVRKNPRCRQIVALHAKKSTIQTTCCPLHKKIPQFRQLLHIHKQKSAKKSTYTPLHRTSRVYTNNRTTTMHVMFFGEHTLYTIPPVSRSQKIYLQTR